MAKKIVAKRITRKVSTPSLDREEISVLSEQPIQSAQSKKRCLFCRLNTTPAYTDTQSLRKFINERSKILPKLKSGVCSKHQRMVTHQIKYARHLALLPFTPKV